MKSFNIPSEKRSVFKDASLLRRLQTGVSVLANRKPGSHEKPDGIYKREGGVTCNGREIAILGDFVKDDFGRSWEETPEEVAVVEALEGLVGRVNKGDTLEEYSEVSKKIFGNNLLAFTEFKGLQ
jgi:hypothetical protein